MKKIPVAAIPIFLFFTSSAEAFIFTDTAALAQRAAHFLQTHAHYQMFLTYKGEFDKYKVEFDRYFQNFRRIYRRLSSLDWEDFNPSDWDRLQDHFITIWKTFDQLAYETQVIALRTNPLYERSPEYRDYADQAHPAFGGTSDPAQD